MGWNPAKRMEPRDRLRSSLIPGTDTQVYFRREPSGKRPKRLKTRQFALDHSPRPHFPARADENRNPFFTPPPIDGF